MIIFYWATDGTLTHNILLSVYVFCKHTAEWIIYGIYFFIGYLMTFSISRLILSDDGITDDWRIGR